jgi:hypothetical protein
MNTQQNNDPYYDDDEYLPFYNSNYESSAKNINTSSNALLMNDLSQNSPQDKND